MSEIEWTDETWNPITGCTKVSAGCKNCYAERMAKRLKGRFGYPADDPFKVTLHPKRLDEPYRWTKSCKVFVVSMGDLFHEDVPTDFINQVMNVATKCPQHTFQFLTKRAGRLVEYARSAFHPIPFNAWLGVSVEDQKTADERIPLLLQCPAKVRWVSVEPMLEDIDLDLPAEAYHVCGARECGGCDPGDEPCEDYNDVDTHRIHWVVCGGESGPGARPMDPDWARHIGDQCFDAGVPFHLKQFGKLGNNPDPNDPTAKENGGKTKGGRMLDGRTYDGMPGD